MKIAMMGSGGVGGYFGARLTDAGNDVAFIARGAQLDAIRKRGLSVRSPHGDVMVQPNVATDDPHEVGPVDIVLFATKLYDTGSAGELCKPLVGDDTAVISLQNGVDAEDQLTRILGESHVAGGVARISAAIAEPGVIEHYSAEFANISFGETDGRESERLSAFLAVAKAAGIDAYLSDHITVEIWQKFVMLATMSAITALTRLPIGPIRDDPRSRQLLHEAVREVVAVAKARGIRLGDDASDKTIHQLGKLPPAMKASMLMDLERGKRLEVEWLSGAVYRMGKELGVETPVHRVALAALAPFTNGTPERISGEK